MANPKKIVLAYSGGLDTSVILTWLKENYGCEVVAFVGRHRPGRRAGGLAAKAKKTGADECLRRGHARGVRRATSSGPCSAPNALYEDTYLLGTSIARPLIAKRQVEVALETGADAV